MKHIAILIGILFFSALGDGQTLSLAQSGSGNTATIAVTSSGQFKLVWEAGDNWGLSQWYDLVNDPSATTNLALAYSVGGPGGPCGIESGLANMTFYAADDEKLDIFEASQGCAYPMATPTMSIVQNGAGLVILKSSANPLVNTSIGTNITGQVTYYVYPNGKIYIHNSVSVVMAEDFGNGGMADLFIADMGLNDPIPGGGGGTAPDTAGWIRADKSSNPWDNSTTNNEPYLFTYWGSGTSAPYANFTKASIMLVLSPNNTFATQYQVRHGWSCGTGCGTLRWGYRYSPGPNMAPGQMISNDYLIQLGTQGSSSLPNMTVQSGACAICTTIANAYAASPNPPYAFISNATLSNAVIQ